MWLVAHADRDKPQFAMVAAKSSELKSSQNNRPPIIQVTIYPYLALIIKGIEEEIL